MIDSMVAMERTSHNIVVFVEFHKISESATCDFCTRQPLRLNPHDVSLPCIVTALQVGFVCSIANFDGNCAR